MTEIKLSWFSAIEGRHSCRSYDRSRPLEGNVKDQLRLACSGFRPFTGARVEFVPDPPSDIFANAIGFYGNIAGASAFFAFIGDKGDPHFQEKVGYTGEAMVLQATALCLGTCWVALTYRSRSALSTLRMGDNDRLIAVSPVGYPSAAPGTGARVASGFSTDQKRKPLPTMLTGAKENMLPEWARDAVNAARRAPSAINRQPWTFDFDRDSITVSVKHGGLEFNVSKRLDCGIAMLHLELGALSHGVRGTWELLERPQVARFTVEPGGHTSLP